MVKRHLLPKDKRGPHIRVYWDLYDSNAWRCLTATDQRVYMALARALTSTSNGDLSLPLSRAKPVGVRSPATLAKSLRALVAVGLIAVTRHGGCTRDGQRLPTLYRLTEYETYANPKKFIEAVGASNDWKAINTLGNGRERIRQAEKLAAEKQAEKLKTQLQNLNGTASQIEAVGALTASNIEVWTPSPTSNIEAGKKSQTARKANNDAGSKKKAVAELSDKPTSNIEVLCNVAIHTPGLCVQGVSGIPAARTRFGQMLQHVRPVNRPAGYHAARSRFSGVTHG